MIIEVKSLTIFSIIVFKIVFFAIQISGQILCRRKFWLEIILFRDNEKLYIGFGLILNRIFQFEWGYTWLIQGSSTSSIRRIFPNLLSKEHLNIFINHEILSYIDFQIWRCAGLLLSNHRLWPNSLCGNK